MQENTEEELTGDQETFLHRSPQPGLTQIICASLTRPKRMISQESRNPGGEQKDNSWIETHSLLAVTHSCPPR